LILADHGMISNEGDFNYHILLQKSFSPWLTATREIDFKWCKHPCICSDCLEIYIFRWERFW